ncbi:MAG: tetratricopeptide repeat protein [Chloroflexi bacterium]|nr:tetratricopeptide repeat protein [Chloroflexota bacterium]
MVQATSYFRSYRKRPISENKTAVIFYHDRTGYNTGQGENSMSQQEYPAYVYRLLEQARSLLEEDDFTVPDAAALCYDVLALFPECQEAANLVLTAFNDSWVIRENRKAIGRLIDEWDDRDWQHRRRLALSYRTMSCWEGQYREYDEDLDPEDYCPSDVKEMLEEGRSQLLQDYLMGESRGSDTAWPIFQAAFQHTSNPRAALLWVADLYADQGFFAESVEVLEQLLAQFPQDDQARRLWAEVRWWREHQTQIPWIPPRSQEDGRRYRHIMRQTDPEFAAHEEEYLRPLPYRPPDKTHLPDDLHLPEPLTPELKTAVETILAQFQSETAVDSPVNWHYLDKLENGDVELSDFPEWAQYMLLEIENPAQQAYFKQWLLQYLSNPPEDGRLED